MLYSKEFYAIINQRLRQDGILQQWLPEGDPIVISAVARALAESFPYVRVFQYFPGFGYQFLASQQPIPHLTSADLVKKMPEAAIRDLKEWPFQPTPEKELDFPLLRETTMAQMLAADPNAQAMHDDHPVNEYVLWRTLKDSKFQSDNVIAWYEHTKQP